MNLALEPYVSSLLQENCPVAIGVSGGKDSCAVAFATTEYLDSIKHTGPRILIHADLGLVEWQDSGPTCARLAKTLGIELIVVTRKAGGMMERWETRWENSKERYAELECVKLILPWSTPAMRFCTAELKRDVICADLVRRFPGTTILSVSGIRRDESTQRAKSPVYKVQPKMTSKKYKTVGYDWHSLLEWKLPDVLAYLQEKNFPLHEAYTKYGSSRVSCAFCILGKKGDLIASSKCEANQEIYRRMCQLEITSTFSFQDKLWLSDIAPHLLDEDMRHELALSKMKAEIRQALEENIPEHLLYTKGWPTCIPTLEEATMLCNCRKGVARLIGIDVKYTEPAELIRRYEELMAQKEAKHANA